MSGAGMEVVVSAAQMVATGIRKLRLARVDGAALPPYSAGAHVVLTLKGPERTCRNAYSLLGTTLAGGVYEVAVQRAPASRGGSAFVHEGLEVGARLTMSAPLNLFSINRTGRHHVLVAGGIGITAIHAMAAELAAQGGSFELHYAMRDVAHGAFAQELVARHGSRVRLYVSARGERFSVPQALRHQPLGTHLYVCGPERMIEGVLADARAEGWPEAALHAERFQAPAGGEPFLVRLARSGLTLEVGADQSLLEAMEEAGVDAPCLCRGGACGQCETTVLAADGELVHRDHYLTAEQRRSGKRIMTCMSRLRGRELVLDL
ncbi:PDR/VanB family oxidoreductase [Xanthobacter sp. TB0136]|uniref:PDR/VanB family oxidoreductase n=1 Tax=Xanthobacter sp. TB0136 TaxID=3459177 RepID=UPI00403985D3